jgi:DNA polymerase III delta prime subunit
VECGTAFLRRAKEILEKENIEYDKMILVEIVKKYFPDYRKILNELQRNSVTGVLQLSGLTPVTDEAIKQLMGFVKQKNFKEFRKWVVQNSDIEFNQIVRAIYDRINEFVVTEDISDLILLLNEYDYRRAFVCDPEVHTVAMLTQMMASIHFK